MAPCILVLMQVTISHDGIAIGRGSVSPSDPTMGVASGHFEPDSGYIPAKYAAEIDGIHNRAAVDLVWVVKSEFGSSIECQSVFIQDYNESLGERHVSILGIPHPGYEDLFADTHR